MAVEDETAPGPAPGQSREQTPGREPARVPARTRLLDAADELFHERGIAATGVDAVLRRAGAAPATLYAHFDGKDALVAAYLQRRHDRWRRVWDEVLQTCGPDPVARMLSVFDALGRLPGAEDPVRGCAFLGAAVEVTDPAHPAHRWLVADTELLTGRLRHLAAEVGAPDPAALAGELLLLYDGTMAARTRRSTWPSAPSGPPVRDLAEAAVRRHLAGAEV